MAVISADVFSDDKIIHKNGRSVKIAPAINMAYFNTSATTFTIFLLLVLADFSLADTPQGRISGRMYVRFLSGWQTVCAAFSKKGTLEKFDNPAICLSDPQIASGASEPLAAVAKATAKYSSYQSRQKHRNTESLQRRQYNRKMMEN